MRAVLLVGVTASVLTGCMWAPGNALDTSNMVQSNVVSTQDDTYLVQQITPEVIVRQSLEAKAAAKDEAAKMDIPLGNPKTFRYLVQPQDILSIQVWDHPELSAAQGNTLDSTIAGTLTGNGAANPFSTQAVGVSQNDPVGFTVNPDGTIFFPYAGNVRVAGHTLDQIRLSLTRNLAVYIRNPQVTVRVLAYRSQQVQMTGELKSPGMLSITDHPLTLADALTRAGGANTTGDLNRVRLLRNGKLTILNAYALLNKGDFRQNVLLEGGDVVTVPDQIDSRVFVLGEVLKPSTLYINNGRFTLADALTGASGIDNLNSNVRQVYVFRGAKENPTEPQIYQLDMTQPGALLLASQFQMDRLDVVYVGTAAGVRFNRVLGLITPFLSNVFYAKQVTGF